MKVRFQADADLNEDIVKGVFRREPGIDFRTASAAKLRELTDRQVLELCAAGNRILVSHDRRTMPAAFAKFIQSNESPGLIIVSQKADLLTAMKGFSSYGSYLKPRSGETESLPCRSKVALRRSTRNDIPESP